MIKAASNVGRAIEARVDAIKLKHQEHVQAGSTATVSQSFATKLAEAQTELVNHLLSRAEQMVNKFGLRLGKLRCEGLRYRCGRPCLHVLLMFEFDCVNSRLNRTADIACCFNHGLSSVLITRFVRCALVR